MNLRVESKGDFTLTRGGNKIKVTGTIKHNFIDKYDWELGLNVTIAGQTVKDEDMKLMEVYKGAKPFDVNLAFEENVDTIVKV